VARSWSHKPGRAGRARRQVSLFPDGVQVMSGEASEFSVKRQLEISRNWATLFYSRFTTGVAVAAVMDRGLRWRCSPAMMRFCRFLFARHWIAWTPNWTCWFMTLSRFRKPVENLTL
jgi:hypothetical protein